MEINMEQFTYERENTPGRLETYEWDNIWWEHAPDNEKKRILIVGDSISCGYRRFVTQELNEDLYADGFGSSKALDNPWLIKGVEYMMLQQNNYEALFFNSGLHGWHLSSDEYKEYYKKTVTYLLKKYKGKNIVIVLTTPTRDKTDLNQKDKRNEKVIERNEMATEIASELGLDIIDLYSIIEDRPELWTNDGIHLIEDGYILLAQEIAQYAKRYIK